MSDFDTFWAAYPRKVAVGQARQTFAKLQKSGVLPPVAELVVALEQAKANGVFPNAKYSPHASTWLNAERWADEFEPDEVEEADYVDPIAGFPTYEQRMRIVR